METYKIKYLGVDVLRLTARYSLLPTDETLRPYPLNLVISEQDLIDLQALDTNGRLDFMRPKVIQADAAAQDSWHKQKALAASTLEEELKPLEGGIFREVTLEERDALFVQPVIETAVEEADTEVLI